MDACKVLALDVTYVTSCDGSDVCVNEKSLAMDGSVMRIFVKRIIGATKTIIIIIVAMIPITRAVRSRDGPAVLAVVVGEGEEDVPDLTVEVPLPECMTDDAPFLFI